MGVGRWGGLSEGVVAHSHLAAAVGSLGLERRELPCAPLLLRQEFGLQIPGLLGHGTLELAALGLGLGQLHAHRPPARGGVTRSPVTRAHPVGGGRPSRVPASRRLLLLQGFGGVAVAVLEGLEALLEAPQGQRRLAPHLLHLLAKPRRHAALLRKGLFDGLGGFGGLNQVGQGVSLPPSAPTGALLLGHTHRFARALQLGLERPDPSLFNGQHLP
mmetsp:Transcript_12756/g.30021  ORF Transcript_12756/g.30021 Transcript_12756/m.30021 type:complete len:216 (+) Transcript_12756:552-1199(+)